MDGQSEQSEQKHLDVSHFQPWDLFWELFFSVAADEKGLSPILFDPDILQKNTKSHYG